MLSAIASIPLVRDDDDSYSAVYNVMYSSYRESLA